MGCTRKFVLAVVVFALISAASRAQEPLAYVSNRQSDDVSVIDISTNIVTDTIPVGPKPRGIALNPACSLLYVALQDSDEVAVIDTQNNNIITKIPVGNEPFSLDVHPSGSPVYVANWGDSNVTVIDASTNAVTADIPVGNQQQNIAFNPSGTLAFVAHRGINDSISIINTDTNTADSPAISVGQGDSKPRDIAFHPSGNTAYVTLLNNDSVSVINARNNSETATIPVGSKPVNMVLSPDGNRAYVTNNADNNVSVINLITGNEIIGVIPVGQTPNGLAITPDGKKLYVANKDDTVSVIDTESNTVTETIGVGNEPWGVSICQLPAKTSQKDLKKSMQIFGSVYRQKGGTIGLLRDNALLELNCDGIINNGKSNTDGRYRLQNPTGIRECTLRAKINGIWTSGSPLEVIFSSKPRRYDLLIEKPVEAGDMEMYYLRKQ